jgi:hypothetical protein
VGHLYALGNTEEAYRIAILGCKGRGTLGRDKPFDHKTGKGSVKARRGDYYDALFNKRAIVVPFIVEVFGGISAHALKYVAQLAQRVTKGGGRDSTQYGRSRTSTRSFFSHHVQQLAAAAQVGDAKAIRAKITAEKMRVMKKIRKHGASALA